MNVLLPTSLDGWRVAPISDVFDINSETLPAATAGHFEFDYLPLEIVSTERIDWSAVQRLKFRDAPSRARRCIKDGDLLIATMRPNLQGFAEFRAVGDGPFVGSTGFAVLRARDGHNPGFYLAQLLSDSGAAQFHAYVTGTNYPAISDRDFDRIRVLVPGRPEEERAISNALNLLGAHISATQAVIAAAERLHRGLMRELLAGRIRPDGSARTAAEFWSHERLGHVPKRWEVRSLRELIRLKNGKSNITSNLRSNREGDYQFPVFGGNGMTGWSDRFFLPEPTVVVGRLGEYCGAIHATPPKSWVTDNALYVEERLAPLDVRFLFHLLTSLRLNRWKATTGQPKITQSDILNIRVAFPEDEDEQRAIADRLAAFHDLIRAKETKIAALQRLKKSLMQNLLTGRMRLSAEAIAALSASSGDEKSGGA